MLNKTMFFLFKSHISHYEYIVVVKPPFTDTFAHNSK